MNRGSRLNNWALDRKLVLVDIENALGFVPMNEQDVEDVHNRIEEVIGIGPNDHVVVGVCHRGLLSAGYGWPSARLGVRSGPDGADLMLLEVLEERVPIRFSEIVLVSGDHIFADKVSQLAAFGVPTTVVARRGSLSRRLRMAATSVKWLPEINVDTDHEEAA